MPFPISYYLAVAGDESAPLIPKTALQQYDNYQIYDLYRLDVQAHTVSNAWAPRRFEIYGFYNDFFTKETHGGTASIATKYFAVQRYAPRPITFDLYTLINKYKSINNLPGYATCRYSNTVREAYTNEYSLPNVVSFMAVVLRGMERFTFFMNSKIA
jgi:hypothetical protein